ncbi:MAG: hypothetical protein PHW01_05015 [Patescibacteria group bacterium]|nr:hypothetical protein [Patescibacteria group bacterium]
MRENFEEDISLYNESAKEKLKEMPALLLDEPFFQRPPEKEIDEIKDISKTIYHLQVEKQRIMKRLHRELAALDEAPEEKNPEIKKRRGRFVVQKDEKLFWQRNEGKEMEITLGEILTDDSWDIIYALDPKTVPRNIRKRYLIEQAENELRALYDYQIIIAEGVNPKLDSFKQDTYKRIFKDNQNREGHPGLIAEKMVENFLKKISLDYDVSFKIIPADVAQDVNEKIDFIIHRRQHYRGVGIRAEKEKKDIGIQFTTIKDPLKIYDKEKQVAKAKKRLQDQGKENMIEDIVLVSIPINKFMNGYNIWKSAKNPGGPDKLWPPETKKEIFSKILSGMLTSDEIEAEWQKVRET